ncbi:unnamed protein product [Rhizopus stolonifer]
MVMRQQAKNFMNNAAIMVDPINLTEDVSFIINVIDYIGNVGYTYELVNYEDVFVAWSIFAINTPKDLESPKDFRSTLDALYYIKEQLQHLSL